MAKEYVKVYHSLLASPQYTEAEEADYRRQSQKRDGTNDLRV